MSGIVGRSQASRLLCSSRPLSADEGASIGLVDRVVVPRAEPSCSCGQSECPLSGMPSREEAGLPPAETAASVLAANKLACLGLADEKASFLGLWGQLGQVRLLTDLFKGRK